ncbi:unnamed protein product [Paramecium sonneborni]|uniref:40S ribosomal protein S27 n=1 Tax=Paramecium sonneborni TaxID=65129 RepID=A0A8S1QM79_9CILI|nr:unnamed protein product [Paramecium sonneborni]
MDQDLLRPQYESEKRKHKLKRLIQAPNSYFMDVKCPQCSTNNTVFSHARGIVTCIKCSTQLGRSTGGKLQLVLGAKYKTKK